MHSEIGACKIFLCKFSVRHRKFYQPMSYTTGYLGFSPERSGDIMSNYRTKHIKIFEKNFTLKIRRSHRFIYLPAGQATQERRHNVNYS